MTTNTQVIKFSLQEIKVLSEGQSPTSEQATDGLNMLNGMLSTWEISGIDLNFPLQDTPGATCPIPAWAEEAVISNLAIRMAPSYNAVVTRELAIKADSSKNALSAYLMNHNLEKADMRHLPQGEVRTRYNIETDS